jgi:Uncharacterized protein conserved in bacteria
MEKKKGNRVLMLRIMLGVCVAVFLASGYMLIRDYIETSRQQETFDQLNSRFAMEAQQAVMQQEPGVEPGEGEAAKKQRVSPQEWREQWERLAQERFQVYQSMKAENSDMIGWIRIQGTNIDYPVMQSPDRVDYYLHRDFYKNKSSYGTPYLSEVCRYEEPRTSLLISGHHMKNGSMFAALQNYTEQEFFEEHPYVQFDTMEEAGSYEVAAVIKLSASGDQSIWQQLLFPREGEDFGKAWERVKQEGFYDTGVELQEEDELLAMVTCEYTLRNGRILLIARRIV